MAKEKNTDFMVAKLLDKSNIKYKLEESGIKEVDIALKTASKKKNFQQGYPEFIGISKDFLLVIEDKLDIEKHIKLDKNNNIMEDIESTTNYAINGAIHYAKHIIKNTNFKKIFAFGISGDEKHHRIQPVYLDEEKYLILDEVETFENFSDENIENYYKEVVLGEVSEEEIELENIIKEAKTLHEDLWKYGALRDTEKPLVVSAILLALEDENFNIKNLIGSKTQPDGKKIVTALENYLSMVGVEPVDKKEAILYNFAFIKNSKQLNEKNEYLKKTPLKYFAEQIDKKIKKAINISHSEDILGRFYSEFVKYGGGDGQGLGIVLTPKHITDLFCELLEIKKQDTVLDPCCGTAGFLISAMHSMLKDTLNLEEEKDVKKNKLFGIEIKDDLFTIATTNMILRGDGKSNLKRANFLEQNIDELKKIKASVGMMNPPYSQAKDKETRHLSELNFIDRLLEIVVPNGRVGVIVPQSTMIGKTKEDKKLKLKILKNHTLEAVITLNKDTFYGVGTNPCIAIFKAHIPHDKNKRSKFINFEDDGYKISKHIGLVETERSKDRMEYLLDVYFDKIDAPSKFLVKTTVEPDDEWLHSFYYFNDEIPTENLFEATIADYLTFEFDMISHNREYLFSEKGEKDVK